MMIIALSLCVTNSEVVLSCSHAAFTDPFTPPSPFSSLPTLIHLGLSSPGLLHGAAGSVFCMTPSGGIGRSLPGLSGSGYHTAACKMCDRPEGDP